MKVRYAVAKCLVKDVVTALEGGGILLPSVIRLAPLTETLHHGPARWSRWLVAHATADGVQNFAKTGSRNFQIPPGNVLFNCIRRCLESNHRLTSDAVESKIKEDKGITANQRLVVAAALLPRTATHLEHIDEVGLQRDLNHQVCVG